MTALTKDRQKLIWATDQHHELYDLDRDPLEQEYLAATQSARTSELERLLADQLHRLKTFQYDSAAHPQLSQDQGQRLQALGYFQSGNGED